MPLFFQSICSSSSGNCLALWSDTTRLLIDCGLSSMKRTRQALTDLFGNPPFVDAVLLTHTHSDHISHYPLRVLEECGLALHLHDDCVDPLREKHFSGRGLANLHLKPFRKKSFTIGDFRIQPFELDHYPGCPTYGYRILHGDKKIVISTDFFDWQPICSHFVDADFIFVESNHDLELLRRYFNPCSRYHMPNPGTAEMLIQVRRESRTAPQQVLLGHISSQRNTPAIAIRETTQAFKQAGVKLDFPLEAVPLRSPGRVITIH